MTLLLLVVVVAVAVAVAVAAATKFAEQYSVSDCHIVMKIGMCSMCAQPPIILTKDKLFFKPVDCGCLSSCDVPLSKECSPHFYFYFFVYVYAFFIFVVAVHRNSKLNKSNKMQQYADIYLLLIYCTCFGASFAPIIRST